MFLGIDLATEKGKTGICILNKKIKTFIIKKDEEIFKIVNSIKPKVVAIDAPLSMPRKRHYRLCDMRVRKAGIPIFSFNLPALKKLARRGTRLKKKLKAVVIETYPYAVLQLNKKISAAAKKRKFVNRHERDAFVCALVAKNYAKSKAKCFCGEGKIFY